MFFYADVVLPGSEIHIEPAKPLGCCHLGIHAVDRCFSLVGHMGDLLQFSHLGELTQRNQWTHQRKSWLDEEHLFYGVAR